MFHPFLRRRLLCRLGQQQHQARKQDQHLAKSSPVSSVPQHSSCSPPCRRILHCVLLIVMMMIRFQSGLSSGSASSRRLPTAFIPPAARGCFEATRIIHGTPRSLWSKNALCAASTTSINNGTSSHPTSSQQSVTSMSAPSLLQTAVVDETEKLSPREKRRRRLGMTKAVDRGQVGVVTYQPGGSCGTQFVARSGLPQALSEGKPFVVLGIESSCDDTGAAVVASNGTILGEALASQSSVHEPFGGVVPGLARDEHEKAIDHVIEMALQRAGLESPSQVDAIGVTVGPGLEICLRVGSTKAAELAVAHNKPFVGVHHLEAHILMARLPVPAKDVSATAAPSSPVEATESSSVSMGRRSIEFPFLSLLVSGGHCLLLKCLGIGRYEILGGTVDDSLGEAFDKVARLLGLPVGGGGGPRVEVLARAGDPNRFPFTVPLQSRKHDLDFSYSGLKTNVRRVGEQLARERGVESMDQLPESDRADLAASFQRVAITHIEQRLDRAMRRVEADDGIQSLAVVGGVAANQELRRRLDALCESRGWTMVVPPPRLCTDQGAMSAWAAVERLLVGSSDDPTQQEVHARYPFAAVAPPAEGVSTGS